MSDTPNPQRLDSQAWYIVPQPSGDCAILEAHQLSTQGDLAQNIPETARDESATEEEMPTLEFWGPFSSREEAIAKRVGLIRNGKCKPA